MQTAGVQAPASATVPLKARTAPHGLMVEGGGAMSCCSSRMDGLMQVCGRELSNCNQLQRSVVELRRSSNLGLGPRYVGRVWPWCRRSWLRRAHGCTASAARPAGSQERPPQGQNLHPWSVRWDRPQVGASRPGTRATARSAGSVSVCSLHGESGGPNAHVGLSVRDDPKAHAAALS